MKRGFIPAIALAGSFSLCATTIASAASAHARGSRAAAFPVSVMNGNSIVHIAHHPARILSISASASEMLYTIGAGKQVVDSAIRAAKGIDF